MHTGRKAAACGDPLALDEVVANVRGHLGPHLPVRLENQPVPVGDCRKLTIVEVFGLDTPIRGVGSQHPKPLQRGVRANTNIPSD